MLKNRTKQVIVMLLALVLVLGGTALNPTPAAAAATKTIKAGDAYYTILSAGNKTVEYTKPTKKTCTSASVPDMVRIGGKTYKVTSIKSYAFDGCGKLKKASIGKNVKEIGWDAFNGCKKLTSITIKTTKLTSNNVYPGAFEKIGKKVVVTVPKSKLEDYRKLLKNHGLSGKNLKITVAKSELSTRGFDPNKSYFWDKMCGFRVGNTSWDMLASSTGETQTNEYSIGDEVEFSSRLELQYPVYGVWREKVAKGGFYYCSSCDKYFDNETMLSYHATTQLDGCGDFGYFFSEKYNKESLFTAWEFVPDSSPCAVTIRFSLPAGVSYKNGSLAVRCHATENASSDPEWKDLTDACHIDISANKITVRIDNIKSAPFYPGFDYKSYCKDTRNGLKTNEGWIPSVIVRLKGVVNSTAGIDNNASCSASYTYKGKEHTLSYDDVSVHTAALKISNTDAGGSSVSGAEFDLYQKKAVYPEGSNLGTMQWVKIAGGLRPGTVINGLGTGDEAGENRYRLVQTKAPDGYKKADNMEFTISMAQSSKTVKVSAADSSGKTLPVEGNVVCVRVTNASGAAKPGSSAGQDTMPSGDGSQQSGTSTPSGGNQAGTEKETVVTYYRDGVRDFWYTHGAEEFDASGMMDTANVKTYAAAFEGCRLEKITVNGKTVNALPEKVPYGTQIGFWYVTN